MQLEAATGARATHAPWPTRGRHLVGGFFLTTAGINVGIVVADPETYRHFADGAYLDFVRRLWDDVVMVHPSFWGLLLAAGELVLGWLLLASGRAARVGWVGVIAFHLLLMMFGPGIWVWCIPALVGMFAAARADWPLSR